MWSDVAKLAAEALSLTRIDERLSDLKGIASHLFLPQVFFGPDRCVLSSQYLVIFEIDMADPISIAAIALQVAGAGFKIGTTLHSCTDAVRKAKGDVKALAMEVSIMSTVLQELGLTLQSPQAVVCRASALDTAKEAIDGCNDAFTEVADAIQEFTSSKGGFSGGFKQLMWPAKQPRMNLLHVQLERRKSTVLLMLGVLNFASKTADGTAESQQRTWEKAHLSDLIEPDRKVAAKLAATKSSTGMGHAELLPLLPQAVNLVDASCASVKILCVDGMI